MAFGFLAPAHSTPVCQGNFCLVNPDSDEEKMFIVKSDDKDSTEVFGSLIKNTSDHDIKIDSPSLFTSGNGFANIKPAKDTLLTALVFRPQDGVNLDGFFTSAQLQDNFDCKGKDCAPDTASPTFWITVNGGETTQAIFSFDLGKFNGDIHDNGFDEAIEGGVGTRIDNLTLWVDTTNNPYVSFKEIKQVTWSPCASSDLCSGNVINPTGGVPEPGTWALMLSGFGLVTALGWKRKRTARLAMI